MEVICDRYNPKKEKCTRPCRHSVPHESMTYWCHTCRVMAKDDKPILFFDTDTESKNAYLLLKSSSIPCEYRCPCKDEGIPLLLVGYTKYHGLEQIKTFVETMPGGS